MQILGRDVHLDMEDDQKVYLKVEEDELEPLRQICVVGAPVACPEKPPPAAAAASVACPEKPPPAAAATGSGQETAERLFSFMLHFHSAQRMSSRNDVRTLLKPHLPEARLGKTIPLQNGWAARIDAYFPSTDAIKGVPEALSSLGTVREVTDKHLETIASWPTHDRVLTVNMRPGMGRLINLDEKRQGCPRTEPPYCGLQLCFLRLPRRSTLPCHTIEVGKRKATDRARVSAAAETAQLLASLMPQSSSSRKKSRVVGHLSETLATSS